MTTDLIPRRRTQDHQLLGRMHRLAVLATALGSALVMALVWLGFSRNGPPGWRLDRLEAQQSAATTERAELRTQVSQVLDAVNGLRGLLSSVTTNQGRLICALAREHQDLRDMACNEYRANRVPDGQP